MTGEANRETISISLTEAKNTQSTDRSIEEEMPEKLQKILLKRNEGDFNVNIKI